MGKGFKAPCKRFIHTLIVGIKPMEKGELNAADIVCAPNGAWRHSHQIMQPCD